MANRTVTLYLDEETIEKLEAFAAVTQRSKSMAADVLLLHGIANYDIKAAAPRKVEKPVKANKRNTTVKQPAKPKGPRVPKGTVVPKRGRPTKTQAVKPVAKPVKQRARKATAKGDSAAVAA